MRRPDACRRHLWRIAHSETATVVKEEAVRALPIVLAGLALIVSIGGATYTLKRTAPLRQQH